MALAGASASVVSQKLSFPLLKDLSNHPFTNANYPCQPLHPATRSLWNACSPFPHRRLITSALAASSFAGVRHESQDDALDSSSAIATSSWSEFAQNVSGEWDGYGADFSSEGKPIELPESVVPQDFREWDVKVFDWQTQCPTLAEPQVPVLTYRLIKLLPTVGCEADAATRYSIDEKIVGGANNMVAAFAYQASGCYVGVWPMVDRGMHQTLEVEHCLINPRDRESRVRVVQVIRVDGAKMVLQNIRVFSEQWYGPFRNGEQLGGCAIRDSAFASTDATKTSEVLGTWQGPRALASFSSSKTEQNIEELIDDEVQKLTRDESNLVMLPKQLWCSLKESENNETSSEVGWLLDHGSAITSRCTFSNSSKLKEVSVVCEAAVSDDV